MKITNILASVVLVSGLAACGKSGSTDSTGDKQEAAKGTEGKAAAKAGAREIPNANGLSVDAPAKWLDNGAGGAAGMHLDADAGMFTVRETAPEEAAKPLADWKAETEQVMFQKWISADATPDGFKAVYALDKMTMKGDDLVKDGSTIAFTVRRKIGGKVQDCSGSASTEAIAAEAVELCNKISAN
ncbi:MAG TPA: hypothetical protein VGM90_33480 [Kofleriaceae bacterium]|jgi:hypothetical protein